MLKMASTSVNLRSPSSAGASTNCPGLYEFLLEAELQQYYSGLKNDLKVQTVAHIKYVEDDDLHQIGMTKPEMRRLKKYHHKYFPHTYLAKIRQMIMTKKDEHGHPAVVEVTESHTDKAAVKVPNKHIIGADNITVHKELGIGEFGVVQQGVWTNEEGERIQVAIKKLSSERMQNNTSDFLKEASIMHNIEHEHIVRLYGVVLDTNAFMLVTELAPLRSLLECVKEPALRPSFPVISLCDTALQICDGMRYLESKRLIHRDLAARNILVFAKNKVKISDFGLSRALGVGKDYYQTNFNVNLKLPIAWCAPECINYLRFTSASDVWAFGVTLWEMFSYGFQPWAALTGQQILEAIDEPHFQRLEQPDCCPKEYFTLMLRCWQHDPSKRPKFSEIFAILPELKSEQVQAIDDHEDLSCSPKAKRDQLVYKVGDVITVLDKKPIAENLSVWKGVLATGKTGLFYPAHTVAYLGTNIPSMKSSFVRGDSKNGGAYSSKRRLRPEMISRPQDDFKHTGHVGLDGAFFGDISFLGDKYNQLPKQIVTPYKPQDDHDQSSSASSSHLARALSDASDRAPLLGETALDSPVARTPGCGLPETEEPSAAKVCYAAASPSGHGQQHRHHQHQHRAPEQVEERQSAASCSQADHEYHEISDEDQNQDDSCPAESQRLELFFQKCLDFGPSLMDEVFKALGTEQHHEENNTEDPDETHNARNEVRELTQVDCSSLSRKKKHQAGTVKPISASDEKTLDSAIAMANELAARSMSGSDLDSPRTPSSPGKRKFSFRFATTRSNGSTGGSPKLEKRNYTDRTACIPDVEEGLTESAKAAYSHLVEKVDVEEEVEEEEEEDESDCAFVAPEETNPLRMLRSGVPVVRPKMRGNKHGVLSRATSQDARNSRSSTDGTYCEQNRSAENVRTQMSLNLNGNQHGPRECKEAPSTTDGGNEAETNPLPLPPRDRTKVLQPHRPRQRKHPLLVTTAGSTARPLVRPSLSLSMPDAVSPTRDGGAEDAVTDRVNSPPTSSSSSFSIGADAKSLISPTSPHSSFSSSSPGSSPNAEPVQGVRSPPPKPPRYSSLEESFDDQIQADIDGLDDIPEEEAPMPPIYKSSDHVSCEDLLDFACDRPNAKRTQGRARGVDSDEVRIMQKVLSTEVSPATCVGALNETEWDVHKAIKYLKLQLLLSHQLVSAASCKQTLMSCNWDVQKAFRCLQSAFDIADDSTEV